MFKFRLFEAIDFEGFKHLGRVRINNLKLILDYCRISNDQFLMTASLITADFFVSRQLWPNDFSKRTEILYTN